MPGARSVSAAMAAALEELDALDALDTLGVVGELEMADTIDPLDALDALDEPVELEMAGTVDELEALVAFEELDELNGLVPKLANALDAGDPKDNESAGVVGVKAHGPGPRSCPRPPRVACGDVLGRLGDASAMVFYTSRAELSNLNVVNSDYIMANPEVKHDISCSPPGGSSDGERETAKEKHDPASDAMAMSRAIIEAAVGELAASVGPVITKAIGAAWDRISADTIAHVAQSIGNPNRPLVRDDVPETVRQYLIKCPVQGGMLNEMEFVVKHLGKDIYGRRSDYYLTNQSRVIAREYQYLHGTSPGKCIWLSDAKPFPLPTQILAIIDAMSLLHLVPGGCGCCNEWCGEKFATRVISLLDIYKAHNPSLPVLAQAEEERHAAAMLLAAAREQENKNILRTIELKEEAEKLQSTQKRRAATAVVIDRHLAAIHRSVDKVVADLGEACGHLETATEPDGPEMGAVRLIAAEVRKMLSALEKLPASLG